MTTDYLIVGQGLAGTVLAYTFIKEGKKVFILDDPRISRCSRVAAGNYNPVVFKRLVKSWKADDIIPFADDFYQEAQTSLKTKFFSKKQIVKIFSEEHERIFWEKKTQEAVGKYLSSEILGDFHADSIQNAAGAGVVTDAGNLYVEKFIDEFRNFFIVNNSLLEEKFDFNRLKISDAEVQYKNISTKTIIFCEGWKAMENPLFNYLPFKPAKGEVLLVSIKNFFCTDKIIHKGIYLFHLENDLFLCGATYEWNELNDFPSAKGKEEIMGKLKKLIHLPFEVIEHNAGVRPSVKDRRPLIGLHPQNKRAGIFNGFGTKGVMLAPYFAKQFFDFLENGIAMDREVDIKRFA